MELRHGTDYAFVNVNFMLSTVNIQYTIYQLSNCNYAVHATCERIADVLFFHEQNTGNTHTTHTFIKITHQTCMNKNITDETMKH